MTHPQRNPDGFGYLRVSILNQAKVWRSADGVTRELEQLDTSHLANIEPYLTKKGEQLRLRWAWSIRVPIDNREGELAQEQWLTFELDRPFADWLAERPLIIRIREILANRQETYEHQPAVR